MAPLYDVIPIVLAFITFWVRLAPHPQLLSRNSSPATRFPEISESRLPSVGLGTAALQQESFQVPSSGADPQVVSEALELGFVLFDTASDTGPWYRNEWAIGKALQPQNRTQLWLTTKVHPADFPHARQSVERSLVNLQTPFLDLVLLHYPHCFPEICPGVPTGTWQQALGELIASQKDGLVRHIGVSNFDLAEASEAQLIALKHRGLHTIQNHYDLFRQDIEVLAFCRRNNINYQGYSLFGGQYWDRPVNPVLTDPNLIKARRLTQAKVASELGDLTPAQALTLFALQEGVHVLVRSKSRQHLSEILDAAQRFEQAQQASNDSGNGPKNIGILSAEQIALLRAQDGAGP